MEEDQCGEEGLLGDVKLSKLLGWAFEESSDREERALRLSEQHEDGRPRVDIQRMLSYYHIIILSWRALYLQTEALGLVLFVSVLCPGHHFVEKHLSPVNWMRDAKVWLDVWPCP